MVKGKAANSKLCALMSGIKLLKFHMMTSLSSLIICSMISRKSISKNNTVVLSKISMIMGLLLSSATMLEAHYPKIKSKGRKWILGRKPLENLLKFMFHMSKPKGTLSLWAWSLQQWDLREKLTMIKWKNKLISKVNKHIMEQLQALIQKVSILCMWN